MNDFLFIILSITLISLFVLNLFCWFQTYHWLKKHHQDIFYEFVEIRFLEFNFERDKKYRNFIAKRKYKELNDNAMSNYFDFMVYFNKLYFVLFALIFLLQYLKTI